MLKCQACGAENDPDAKFCIACGAELTAAPLFTNASQMGRPQQELLNRKVKFLSIVSIALGALLLIFNLISTILLDESDMVFWVLACLLIACGVSLLVTVCK
ncbi:MAG: zinc-ribbon domain-containing protein, partial [Christensenellaceae bacterium]